MSQYPYGYFLRLTNQDYTKLKQQSELAGLNCSDYLRKLISQQEIKPKPPDSYKQLVWEISKIGNNINQIARQANTVGSVSTEQAETAVFLMEKCIELMREMG